MKVCNKCNQEKELICFGKNKQSKDGLNYLCKSCLQNKYLKDKLKPDFKEKRDKNFQKHKSNNPEYYKQKDKENYKNNKDYWKIKNKIYKEENKNSINIQLRNKYQSDPVYRNKKIIYSLIYNSFNSSIFLKNTKTQIILGCTFEEFKLYLESKFEPWMNWNSQGNPKDKILEINKNWDIDHIIPISSAKTEEEVIKLNHYTNFQPLCSYKNRYIKRNLINYE